MPLHWQWIMPLHWQWIMPLPLAMDYAIYHLIRQWVFGVYQDSDNALLK